MTRAELVDEAVRLGLLPGSSAAIAERRLAKLAAAQDLVESEDHSTTWEHQGRRCGRADCWCAKGDDRHGPYLTLRYAEGAELYSGNGRSSADWKRVYIGPVEPVDAGTANLAEEWEKVLA